MMTVCPAQRYKKRPVARSRGAGLFLSVAVLVGRIRSCRIPSRRYGQKRMAPSRFRPCASPPQAVVPSCFFRSHAVRTACSRARCPGMTSCRRKCRTTVARAARESRASSCVRHQGHPQQCGRSHTRGRSFRSHARLQKRSIHHPLRPVLAFPLFGSGLLFLLFRQCIRRLTVSHFVF